MSDNANSAPTSAPSDEALRASGKPMEHSYDGIREYDNPLPGWWTAIFIATAIHSLGYMIWYHWGGPGKSETEQYALDWAEHTKLRDAVKAKEQASVSEEAIAARAKDPAAMSKAKEVFGLQCAACHGPAGAGLVGPNLTDNFQIHGNSRKDIYVVIRDGVIDKGMVPWGTMLPHDQVVDLAAYVANLRGLNLEGKAKEGAEVVPFGSTP